MEKRIIISLFESHVSDGKYCYFGQLKKCLLTLKYRVFTSKDNLLFELNLTNKGIYMFFCYKDQLCFYLWLIFPFEYRFQIDWFWFQRFQLLYQLSQYEISYFFFFFPENIVNLTMKCSNIQNCYSSLTTMIYFVCSPFFILKWANNVSIIKNNVKMFFQALFWKWIFYMNIMRHE